MASGNGKKQLVEGLTADLADETRDLAAVLDGLRAADWDQPTQAEGWSIRDQVTHLAFFDDAVVVSLRDPDGFAELRAGHQALGDHFPDIVAERHRHLAGAEALSWLTRSRDELLAAYRAADPAGRLPWYGPEMSVASSVTARIMETWAHGQDIRDTVGAATAVTPRLRHIANLGVRTFGFCFGQRGLDVPSEPVGVELAGPDGDTWTWGPSGAANRVTGDALDFCLVVTQRRAAADTGLAVTGPVAEQWIAIAQAFAGRPTDPPSPGSREGGSR
ncbi:MAG: TIGR03084 family metal-binding protein [Streptosporangiales bacterium]|nr:TIGR03084 family metal-binding protein [Streptosporangiales bacterium]